MKTLLIILYFLTLNVSAQNTLFKGVVKDTEIGIPLKYALVELLHNETMLTSCITDDNGFFSLYLPSLVDYKKFSLKISRFCYEKFELTPIPNIEKTMEFYMVPKVVCSDHYLSLQKEIIVGGGCGQNKQTNVILRHNFFSDYPTHYTINREDYMLNASGRSVNGVSRAIIPRIQ